MTTANQVGPDTDRLTEPVTGRADTVDVIVVGAGLAGIAALYRFRERGMSVRVVEAGDGIGGTWFWNNYPGARCDCPSSDYSYSFSEELQQKWHWRDRFPTQPELLRYINHVADRFEMWPHITLSTRVTAARYDDDTSTWTIETDAGETVVATYCVFASGALSVPREPPFPGLETFAGDWYQTSRWPKHEVDLSGLRVACIGTGSSGVQFIPTVAPMAEHLFVFQRSAAYSIPARNHPIHPDDERRLKANYAEYRRTAKAHAAGMGGLPSLELGIQPFSKLSALEVSDEERRRHFEWCWAVGGFETLTAYADLLFDERANEYAAEFIRDNVNETVTDPEVANRLHPRDYFFGTKRPTVDTDYYETFNRNNVTLVDIKANPIAEIVAEGVKLADGTVHEVDVIAFAIGFDAITGALLDIDIYGSGGVELRKAWSERPEAYLGLMVAGFPNMFTINGPGSVGPFANMVMSIEQNVDFIAELIRETDARDASAIDAEPDSQAEWVDHVTELASQTLHMRTQSWYNGLNVPGKAPFFLCYLGGLNTYTAELAARIEDDCRGFRFE